MMRTARHLSLAFHASWGDESSKTIHLPGRHLCTCPAILIPQLSGTSRPRWHLTLMFVGPLCGAIFVFGPRTAKNEAPAPFRTTPFRFRHDAVIGQRLQFASFRFPSSYSANT